MFKSLSLLLLAGWLSIGSTMQTSGVYICDSKDAKKFHLVEKCRGLSACKHEIVFVTREAASQRGLTLCGFED
ncbi:MAG: hypothetical protein V4604_07020 [Bacteroidota bacterium]|nr:MAG: hypothetical protein CHH17_13350 [Candidatus Fluviicola riflensis]OGS77136.1 MAG: hypothetical protein A3D31_08940 [Candidatus Fluviicola riflensis]OGS82071.1 MAG: hypothetical protein A2724_17885 [Fluviicola sp. RIFCSPHIGHO2_01_FULL_43_53]OGS87765.1 MAG: hypothetical protein A3E30_15320 [Fluviicola sp. RIFCSPHIGHO2_12_FULL_43_24]